jgi:putative lipoprotein
VGKNGVETMLLSGLEEFTIFGFVPLMIGILAVPAASRKTERTLAGKVTIPSYRSVPAEAVVMIELVEHRRGETNLPVVARETVNWRGSDSQKFAIRFDPTFIRPMSYYAVQARVIAEGTVRFETQYPQPAAPLSGDPITLALAPTVAKA